VDAEAAPAARAEVRAIVVISAFMMCSSKFS